jgi:hypothetical protein
MNRRHRRISRAGLEDAELHLGPAAFANLDEVSLPTTAYVPLAALARAALGPPSPAAARPSAQLGRRARATGTVTQGYTGRRVCLTEQPVRVTTTTSQDLRLAVDALPYDEVTLLLRVLNQEGTPGVTLVVQSGMQLDTSTTWVEVKNFGNVATTNGAVLATVTDHLRYLRWAVTALTATSATFVIEGIGRSSRS